jgi:hypothetical protein
LRDFCGHKIKAVEKCCQIDDLTHAKNKVFCGCEALRIFDSGAQNEARKMLCIFRAQKSEIFGVLQALLRKHKKS